MEENPAEAGSMRAEESVSHTYAAVYYHFVWATKRRNPLITPEVERVLHGYIRRRCTEMGVVVYALNGVEDHVHMVCSIPPTLALANVIEIVKGASSHFINCLPDSDASLYWQPGYAVLTFSRNGLSSVVDYVQNQKQHHAVGTTKALLEKYAEDGDPSPL
jgi:REP element-mobilizing transposase RayT